MTRTSPKTHRCDHSRSGVWVLRTPGQPVLIGSWRTSTAPLVDQHQLLILRDDDSRLRLVGELLSFAPEGHTRQGHDPQGDCQDKAQSRH